MDDLIEGFVRLMYHLTVEGPLNVGNPYEFTMLELAELVLEKVGAPPKLTFHPLPGDDQNQPKPDKPLAQTKFDWKPQVSHSDGLDSTIACFRKLLA